MSFFKRIIASFKARVASREEPAAGDAQAPPPVPWLARALELLQEDEGLTADLTDDAARLLLRYAEEQVTRMAAETKHLGVTNGSTALEERFTALRITLRRIAGECARAEDPLAAVTQRLENLVIDPQE